MLPVRATRVRARVVNAVVYTLEKYRICLGTNVTPSGGRSDFQVNMVLLRADMLAQRATRERVVHPVPSTPEMSPGVHGN